jgi:hypothetical protein
MDQQDQQEQPQQLASFLLPGEGRGGGQGASSSAVVLVPGASQRDQVWEQKLAARRAKREVGTAENIVAAVGLRPPRHPSGAQFDVRSTDEDLMMLASRRNPAGGGGAQQQQELQQHELQAMAAEALYEEYGSGGLGEGGGEGQCGVPHMVGAGQRSPASPRDTFAAAGPDGATAAHEGVVPAPDMVGVDADWIKQLLLDRDRLRRQLRDANIHPCC